jgi:hypothetical protein
VPTHQSSCEGSENLAGASSTLLQQEAYRVGSHS